MNELCERVEPVLSYIRTSWDATVRRVGHNEPPRLYLPHPFTAPCESDRFQELYYWDTYFAHLGMLRHERFDLARDNIRDMFYMIEHFGHVLNSNATYHLNRSQPPYLSMMVEDLHERTQDDTLIEEAWGPLRTEYEFWTSRRSTPTGLSRYLHAATDSELVHFYRGTLIPRLGLEETDEESMREIGFHYTAEAESGHDFTPRFRGRCADHVPIDLNANLYRYERNFADFARILGRDETEWRERAADRLARLRRYCWDADLGCFNDYDFAKDETTGIVHVAAFWPLAYGMATQSEASSTVRLLRRLERPHGVTTCEDTAEARRFQWGYPNAWPPMQVMVARALARYGLHADARRVARTYVETAAAQFEKTGCLWEKYDAVTGEPGGSEYEPARMLGWSAGAFVSLCEIAGAD